MDNSIRTLTVAQVRLDAAEAELRVVVEPERLTATTEARGRLHGPRRPGEVLLEDSFTLIGVPGHADEPGRLVRRVLIAEPMVWTAERPLVYEGEVELWESGRKVDARPVTVRFRA